MTSDVSRGISKDRFLDCLRTTALTAVLAGAGGSFGLMLRAGRRNHSRILMVLMAGWVLSPFMAPCIGRAWFRSIGRRLPERRSIQ